ncbi:MAG TPA: hypothetical protein VM581_00805 [Magnetospirillaceae bacterium]|nr:hypothetical protein [Magnetospirillaceae bacterium]
MRKFVKSTLVAVVAALLIGPSMPGNVVTMTPLAASSTNDAEQRDTSQISRSFNRANCPPDDCPGREPAPTPSASPTPPPAPPALKSCTKIKPSIWKGPCPQQPSKDVLRQIAREVLAERGWNTDAHWSCLVQLVEKESSWNPYSENSIHAYGLPQAMPGSKMASAGSDWGHNPRTQLRWMMGYIAGRYKTPCGAWSAWNRQYDSGGHHWY